MLVAVVVAVLVMVRGPGQTAPGEAVAIGLTVGATMLSLIWINRSAAAQAYIKGHTRALALAGVLVCGVSILGPFIAFFSAPQMFSGAGWSDDVLVAVVVGGVLVGSLLIFMPLNVRQLEAQKAGIATLRAHPQPASQFDGVRAALAAYRFVLTHDARFLSLGGPWILLCAALLGAMAPFAKRVAAKDIHAVNTFLAVFLLYLVAWTVTPILFAIAWQRFALQGRAPRWGIAVPDSAFLRGLWRMVLFNGVMSTMDKQIAGLAPDIAKMIGSGYAPLATNALDALAWFLVLSWVGLAGLAAPAIALGDRTMTVSVSIATTKRLGRGYFLGLLVTAGPFFVLEWALGAIPNAMLGTGLTPQAVAVDIATVFIGFACVAVVTTYLARVYATARPGTVTEWTGPVTASQAAV